ncbi:hypothetical protein CYMTET_4980 [Cymbomonas tetramitiformis]|uniref:Uncharacterized protein n=1 Tax=Cymbomonas tetramitiformis TaxID=36881 RepID=A0AAE0H0B0_9CHLO|nr:hypothetical protein CYMTET_4980 [Cymbomonas tetramitiformis]|eukprot:gene11955-14121_t
MGAEDGPAAQQSSSSKQPFLPSGMATELGLPPIAKPPIQRDAPPPDMVTKHKRYILNEIQKERAKREGKIQAKADELAHKQKLSDFSSGLRSRILNGQDVSDKWAPAAAAKEERAFRTARATGGDDGCVAETTVDDKDISALDAEMAALVDGALSGAVKDKPLSDSKPKKQKDKLPAWALTEEDAEKKEEEEEAELLSFVDDLDYDQYIEGCDDADLKEALRLMAEAEAEAPSLEDAMQEEKWKSNFAIAMNHLANKDAVGMAGGGPAKSMFSRGSQGPPELGTTGEKKGWNSSTKGGDDDAVPASKLAAAQAFLSEDPDMAKMHSTKSARALLEKAQE